MRERRDDIVCYCGDGVTNSDFISDVQENHNLGFDEICAIRGVGHQCTACLLDAEAIYYETMANIDAAPIKNLSVTKEAAEPTAAPGLKRRIFDLVDHVLPKMYRLRREIAPIFASQSLTTTLTISNQYPSEIGPRNAPIRFRLVCFDANGRRYS